MFDLLKSRFSHGYQAVKDIPGAKVNPKYRGFPLLDESAADALTVTAAAECPTGAITASPLSIDIGRCSFCGECTRLTRAVSFTNFHHTASTSRKHLVITPALTPENYKDASIEVCNKIRSFFGRSLKLRSVSAGGCNACEMELNACGNVNFDMGRYGIDIVASPRHADGLVITGPVSGNMAAALEDTYNAMPSPKIVIAMGSCAISGGVFAESPAVDRKFFDKVNVDLYIPGCPPHPLTMVNGLIDLIGRKG
jgi:Ni,Fe-hydrogenase III small subunit